MIEYDKTIFARNLQRYMSITDTKQTDICRLLRVSKSTVSAWCAAQKMPRMDKIEMLANHFGIMKSDLIEENPATATDDGVSQKHHDFIEMVKKLDPEQFQMVKEIVDSVIRSREK